MTGTPRAGLATGAGADHTGPVMSHQGVEQPVEPSAVPSDMATRPAGDLAVRVQRLTVRFGAVDAVRGVDL